MTDDEKRTTLQGIQGIMAQVQILAEQLSGYVLRLEAAGVNLPAMRKTATTLAEVALGWADKETA